MDGGAYCTLSPVVLSRGTLHAGGPYACPNVRIRSRAVATNTPPNGAFRGFGAPQTEFAAEMQVNRIAEALGDLAARAPPALALPAGRYDADRPGPARERRGRGGPRPGRRGGRVRAGPGADGGDRSQPHGRGAGRPRARMRPRDRPGPGLARRRLHRLGRGPPRLGRLGRADRRRPDRDPDRLDRDGPGDQDDLPAAGRRGARRADGRGRAGLDVDTALVPDSGPTVASRTAMVVGGLVIGACRRLRAVVEAAPAALAAARSRSSTRADARTHGATRIDQHFEPYPGVDFDDTTYRGDAYPAFGWASASPKSTSTSTPARWPSGASSPPTTSAG